mmetsp:Transcript_11619/g.20336  ORF Transcript_11619/g.20336 Transcript_11619/m.20336 type:complete len:180 (+) Transcript_11619:63-602(+)
MLSCALSILALACISDAVVLRGNGPAADSADPTLKLEALQPVLEKLRGLDPKTFGMLNGMLGAASKHSTSFIQYVRDDPEEVEAKLEKLGPILEHLKGLDGRAFGALTGLVKQVQPAEEHTHQASFLQSNEDPDVSLKLEKLGPVLDKLKGLDGKAFGMLSNLMVQAEQSAGKQSNTRS